MNGVVRGPELPPEPEGCICRTDARDNPCPVPGAQHVVRDVVILQGPDSLGRYQYAREWWRADTSRRKAQIFFGVPPDVPVTVDAR